MRSLVGPFTQPGWRKRLAVNVLTPLQGTYSGEVLTAVNDFTLGASRFAGEVTGVWMAVQATGKDDSNELNISGEIYICGTTCLTTTPKIAHISGELSQKRNTRAAGTGIVQAVVDITANTFDAGDVLSGSFTLTRTASPTTEIKNPVLFVELEPIK